MALYPEFPSQSGLMMRWNPLPHARSNERAMLPLRCIAPGRIAHPTSVACVSTNVTIAVRVPLSGQSRYKISSRARLQKMASTIQTRPEQSHLVPDSARKSASLEGIGLVKRYGGRAVVNQVDVRVGHGEVVGLLGPNGAGKTTTFYMLVGLLRPDSGRIAFGGDDITMLPLYQRARRGISYLPQEPSVFRKLSVEQNLLAVLETLPLTDEERQSRLQTLLDELDIARLRKSRAGVLSGGERRKVEITRALVLEPQFLCLDE